MADEPQAELTAARNAMKGRQRVVTSLPRCRRAWGVRGHRYRRWMAQPAAWVRGSQFTSAPITISPGQGRVKPSLRHLGVAFTPRKRVQFGTAAF